MEVRRGVVRFASLIFGPGAGVGMSKAKPGDWECSNCGSITFASKTACFKCHTPKPVGLLVRNGHIKPGDWECPNCHNICFAKPRNRRHFDTIGGGIKCVSDVFIDTNRLETVSDAFREA